MLLPTGPEPTGSFPQHLPSRHLFPLVPDISTSAASSQGPRCWPHTLNPATRLCTCSYPHDQGNTAVAARPEGPGHAGPVQKAACYQLMLNTGTETATEARACSSSAGHGCPREGLKDGLYQPRRDVPMVPQ